MTISLSESIPWSWDCSKRKRTLPRSTCTFLRVPRCCHLGFQSTGAGMGTCFPFEAHWVGTARGSPHRGEHSPKTEPENPEQLTRHHPPLLRSYPCLLGPANSCSIAVHTKPFPTSAPKVLIWVLATTAKICTRGCSTPPHGEMLLSNPHASLLP